MFFIVLRKMFQNKWLSFCLLLGFVLAVATASSIPMFTQGASFNEYTKSLRNSQEETGIYPGNVLVGRALSIKSDTDYTKIYQEIDNRVTSDLIDRMELPVQASAKYLKSTAEDAFLFRTSKISTYTSLASLSNLEEHVNVIKGRINKPGIHGDTIEAVITPADLIDHRLSMNKAYDVNFGRVVNGNKTDYKLSLKIVIVGIVEPKSKEDLYWFYNFIGNTPYSVLYIDQETFLQTLFTKEPIVSINAQWYAALDYTKITTDSMNTIKELSKEWNEALETKKISIFDMTIAKTFIKYTESEKLINNIMWLFSILVFVIITFYILMISKLIIDYDKNEIVLITSRGGSKLHILKGYLLQCLSIGLLSLGIGPILGIFICQIIGSSNSFLEFTNRKAIPIVVSFRNYWYSIIVILIITVVILVTAAIFSGTSLIKHKQGKGRNKNATIYFKILLSLSLIILSIYWLFSYKMLAKRAGGFLPNADGLPIDPMLFLNASLMIIGTGLFLTNIFPFIVKLVFIAGKRFWSTSIYTAFVQVARSAGQEQFLMLFIVLTLSIGVFSANSARTINANAEDAIRYQTGADITLLDNWEYIADENALTTNDYIAASWGNKKALDKIQSFKERAASGLLTDKYIEPDFEQYTGLQGVDKVTKVYVEESTSIAPIASLPVRFLAIDTNEFGKTAWFRSELLPFHWYEYLNLLADIPNGVLLSSSFKDKKIKAGDEITLRVAKQNIKVVVVDFVDYWPSFTQNITDPLGKSIKNNLVVANFGYIFNSMPIKPYEVWIKKKPGYSGADILKELKAKAIEPLKYKDTDKAITELKREPAILSTNGSLTLGFILTMIICLSGFLIYWVIALKKRALQFGIMRAMGISTNHVIGMLVFEHLLISGSAIIAGISVGAAVSRIFIPVYELFYNTKIHLLPFQMIAQRADYIKLYFVVAFMLLVAFFVLFIITRNIKVTQIIKLGED